MNITILGAGAWGTALATLLHEGNHRVTLWDYQPAHLDEMRRTARNEVFLPGISLPPNLLYEADAHHAIRGAEMIVTAVPSRAFRKVTHCLRLFPGLVVTVTKGIESESGFTMSQVLSETAPNATSVALSGPTLAMEVARSIPTAIVAASEDPKAAQRAQELFHRPTFRVYTSSDISGVEFGGALKNVIAIAAGICDGLGFGDNSKAALITRGIAEMRRLGTACGAQADTFAGLSGIGDLTVTCFSKLSRNRGFGERLGHGEKPDAVLSSMVSVAEGYTTSESAHALAKRKGVATPIIEEVYAMLYQGKNLDEALNDLMTRETKPED